MGNHLLGVINSHNKIKLEKKKKKKKKKKVFPFISNQDYLAFKETKTLDPIITEYLFPALQLNRKDLDN